MGGTPIILTPQPISQNAATAQTVKQDRFEALDVSGFDYLDLQLGTLVVTGSNTLTVSLLQSNTLEQDDGSWITLLTFTGVSGATIPSGGTWEAKSTINTPLLKYVRWQAAWSAGGWGAFWLNGFGRSYR